MIDGKDVSARADQSILDAARENAIPIPTLCHLDGLSEAGACRLCLVELKGTPRLQPACVTLVEEGMEVTTQSPRLEKYRRMVVELLFAERNHVCSVCVSNNMCELQDMAKQLGVTHVRSLTATPACPWTPPTNASPWTTTAASYARVVFACAPRSKARTPGAFSDAVWTPT